MTERERERESACSRTRRGRESTPAAGPVPDHGQMPDQQKRHVHVKGA